MKTTNESCPTTDITLSITRTFNAPRELVWRAWTCREHLMKWFCPTGFRVEFAEVDLCVGGRWRAGMLSPNENQYVHCGEYREIDQPQKLVLTHTWEKNENEPAANTVITIQFEESEGKTVMHFEQIGFATEASRDSHNGGWNGAFDNFDTTICVIG